jgi:hypothetical protein
LVYNPGERVEGYTNFLWVIILAGLHRLTGADLVTLARVASFLAATAAGVLAGRLAVQLSGRTAGGVLTAVLLATHSGFAAWSVAGLETPLFSLLVLGGVAATVHHLRGGPAAAIPVWFALAALTRADGAIFLLVSVGAVGIRTYAERGWAGLRGPVRILGVFAAIYLPYLLWRYSYYGDWIPNTAYAKVGGGLLHITRGIRQVGGYVVDYAAYLWFPAVVAFLWRRRELWMFYLCGLIGIYVAYVTYVGGDSLGFHRFFVHLAPLMALVIALALIHVWDAVKHAVPMRPVVVVAAVALLGATSARSTAVPILLPQQARWHEPQSGLSFPGDGTMHDYRWFITYFVDRLAVAARYLNEHAPPGSVVASTPAGAIAYYMDLPVIDMLGLTDRHIARTSFEPGEWRYGRSGHEKGDGAYVLGRNPDYVLLGNVAVLPVPLDDEEMAGKLTYRSEHEIWADPDFHARYERVTVRLAERGPFQYFTYYQRRR